jgi:hypothetical protein
MHFLEYSFRGPYLSYILWDNPGIVPLPHNIPQDDYLNPMISIFFSRISHLKTDMT